MTEQWKFITSNRFWSICIGAIAVYLKTKGLIGEPEMLLVATITSGFVLIRTTDRLGEKLGPQPEKIILNELPAKQRRQV